MIAAGAGAGAGGIDGIGVESDVGGGAGADGDGALGIQIGAIVGGAAADAAWGGPWGTAAFEGTGALGEGGCGPSAAAALDDGRQPAGHCWALGVEGRPWRPREGLGRVRRSEGSEGAVAVVLQTGRRGQLGGPCLELRVVGLAPVNLVQ